MIRYTDLIEVVAGDELPDVYIQLKDSQNNETFSVAGSVNSVSMRFRKLGSSTTLFDASLSKVNDGLDGLLKLVWPSSALDITTGRYEGQVYVTNTSTGVRTALNVVKFKVLEKFAAVV